MEIEPVSAAVVVILVIIGRVIFARYTVRMRKYDGKKGHQQIPQKNDPISPQMGFPIEQGITGWQEPEPAPKPVHGFDQVSELIRLVQNAPPLEPQKEDSTQESKEDPWARAYAEGHVHRVVPPRQI